MGTVDILLVVEARLRDLEKPAPRERSDGIRTWEWLMGFELATVEEWQS